VMFREVKNDRMNKVTKNELKKGGISINGR